MSDNSFGDNFGPSTSGALNVISGDTYGAVCGPTSAVFRSTRARLHPVRGPRVSHRRTT